VELEEAEPERPNVLARWGKPDVVLSTHIDTVPPFFPSREDDEFIHGRGSCDAKGILAAQVEAAVRLVGEGVRDIGLLFLVGEERNNAGAYAANKRRPGARYLINGEPTENLLAIGTKGVLRLEFEAKGRMAHSAYPELGESATEKLIEACYRLRDMKLPEDELLGKTTYNIGIIAGGVAPNVIPGSARAEVMYRLVSPADELQQAIEQKVGSLVEIKRILEIPAVRLNRMDGLETTVVAFCTDIPTLSNWGKPYLLGPGSIRVAHTDHECVAKKDLVQAAEIYVKMVKKLKRSGTSGS
jgi:acetylornithine deacetylase